MRRDPCRILEQSSLLPEESNRISPNCIGIISARLVPTSAEHDRRQELVPNLTSTYVAEPSSARSKGDSRRCSCRRRGGSVLHSEFRGTPFQPIPIGRSVVVQTEDHLRISSRNQKPLSVLFCIMNGLYACLYASQTTLTGRKFLLLLIR